MKPILLSLFFGFSFFAMAQETGKPVDYSSPKAGDYIRVEGYIQDWCSGRLRPILAYEMDEALDSMRLLPNWKFQIEVHTDCRAGHAYNDTFSQARADTLLAYYLMKGFPSWRITAKGMGERMLLMEKCSCDLTDYNNQICEEKEHQLNRRTIIRLTEKINWTGHEPLSLKFPSPGQFRAIPFENSGDEAVQAANGAIWQFLDSLSACEGVHYTLYHLPGKRALTKPFVTQKRKNELTSNALFSSIPSRMNVIHKRPGKRIKGIQSGYVVLIDSVVSKKKIMDEVGISGDSRVIISDVIYVFQKPVLLEDPSLGGLNFPTKNNGASTKYRLYIVTTDYPECLEYYDHHYYKRWIACQDTSGEDYIGYSARVREEFPNFPEIVEVKYINVPELKRPWMLILQPIKEEE